MTDPLMEVMAERARQDEKWGVQDHDDPAWMMILAEELGEVAELVAKAMQSGDPYRPVVDALIALGAQAKSLIEDACELGDRQLVNTPGVQQEAMQSTAVGLAWLECMERRATPATVGATGEQGLDREGGVQRGEGGVHEVGGKGTEDASA